MVTSPHHQNYGERCGKVHGVSGEVCLGVGGGDRVRGAVGRGVGGGVGKCVGVWREVRKDVWESVWGEWGSVLACGERMWGEKWEGYG